MTKVLKIKPKKKTVQLKRVRKHEPEAQRTVLEHMRQIHKTNNIHMDLRMMPAATTTITTHENRERELCVSRVRKTNFDSHLLIKIASAADTCSSLSMKTTSSCTHISTTAMPAATTATVAAATKKALTSFFTYSHIIEHKRLIKPNRDTFCMRLMFAFQRFEYK